MRDLCSETQPKPLCDLEAATGTVGEQGNSPPLWLEWGGPIFLRFCLLESGDGVAGAAVERPSLLERTWEGTYDSCKCDDIGNDRLSSRLVVCNWSQEFSTRSDTPSLHCGSQKSVPVEPLGWEDPHLTNPPSQAQSFQLNSRFPNLEILFPHLYFHSCGVYIVLASCLQGWPSQ